MRKINFNIDLVESKDRSSGEVSQRSIFADEIEYWYQKTFSFTAACTSSNNKIPLRIQYIDCLGSVLEKTNNIVILTGWKEFKENKEIIFEKNVFDFRYIY